MRGFILVGLGLLGCSSSSESKDKYPTIESFCEARAKEECQVAGHCAVDAAACVKTRAAACTTESSSKGRPYTAAKAEACVATTKAAYADALLEPQEMGAIADKCERVFAGATAIGQSCTSDYQCAGDAICSPAAPGASERICAARRDKKLDEFCADPGSVCEAGSYCKAGTPAKCVKKLDKLSACSEADPCSETLRCGASTCLDRVGTGQPCTVDGDCVPEAPYCDHNAQSICTRGKTFAAGSKACDGYR
jgi:hypothetical protein